MFALSYKVIMMTLWHLPFLTFIVWRDKCIRIFHFSTPDKIPLGTKNLSNSLKISNQKYLNECLYQLYIYRKILNTLSVKKNDVLEHDIWLVIACCDTYVYHPKMKPHIYSMVFHCKIIMYYIYFIIFCTLKQK